MNTQTITDRVAKRPDPDVLRLVLKDPGIVSKIKELIAKLKFTNMDEEDREYVRAFLNQTMVKKDHPLNEAYQNLKTNVESLRNDLNVILGGHTAAEIAVNELINAVFFEKSLVISLTDQLETTQDELTNMSNKYDYVLKELDDTNKERSERAKTFLESNSRYVEGKSYNKKKLRELLRYK